MIDWQRIWYDNEKINRFSPTRAILYFLSLFYRLIINLRNWLYNNQTISSLRLSCPVISIGNITVGGTGKTPCVIMLAQMLQKAGFRPAVISRGYGSKQARKINVVSDGEKILLDFTVAGDEPLLIAQSLQGIPVITGARRVKTGSMAIERFGANVIICDDAFQHRRIARNTDIVLLDYKDPLSNGYLLPRGALREPTNGLNRANCIIITRVNGEMKLNPKILSIAQEKNIPVFYSIHYPEVFIQGNRLSNVSIEKLKNKKICAFCGIANPNSFYSMLINFETDIISFNAFPDHYRYSPYDLEELKNQFVNLRADYLITTEKDAMRLRGYPDFLNMIYVLRIKMQVIPPTAEPLFEKFILQHLKIFSDSQ